MSESIKAVCRACQVEPSGHGGFCTVCWRKFRRADRWATGLAVRDARREIQGQGPVRPEWGNRAA